MTNISRRSLMKMGGALMAATALTPSLSFAQAASINY
ncbi:MAG: twin-arginine translocation signal domain-containing protein [Devosia sp.]|jgi:hypothetical protein